MRLEGKIMKAWGHEDIFVSNDDYCGKYLVFDYAGGNTSMHFHAIKKETWKVIRGKFVVRQIDTDVGETNETVLKVGDIWHIDPLVPHQLIALVNDSCVLEISTADSIEDNYRLYR